ncbi:MAG: hypothetical protein WDO69_31500 [Pseudomonadota bacterium]
MRNSLVMSLIGATSMALALLVGCGDDDEKPVVVTSKVGQSCTRTADCDSGLSCIGNVCYKTPPPEVGGGGGDSPVNPVPPVRGGEGESCSSRLDCIDTLGCFNNRCTASDTGDGGAPSSTGVQLGARGESCRVNGDCTKDLVCVPSAVTGTGVCDVANFGIVPTGKSCGGECLEDADCCQLPVALHTTTVTSCEDIADAIKADATDCDAPATPTAKTLCFEQATYCDCAKETWSCTDNTCVYGVACVVAAGADVPTGCPSYSRTRSLATLTCNADTLECVGPQAVVKCTNDKSCEGKPVSDRTNDVCGTDECTCYAADKQCYKKCARDIDCDANQVCDTAKSKLCKSNGACTSDSYCAVLKGSTDFKCNAGACARACTVDRDCSPSGVGASGVNNGFNGQVCGADGLCASVQNDCDENTQCPLTNGLKTFCIDNKEDADTFSSAITD